MGVISEPCCNSVYRPARVSHQQRHSFLDHLVRHKHPINTIQINPHQQSPTARSRPTSAQLPHRHRPSSAAAGRARHRLSRSKGQPGPLVQDIAPQTPLRYAWSTPVLDVAQAKEREKCEDGRLSVLRSLVLQMARTTPAKPPWIAESPVKERNVVKTTDTSNDSMILRNQQRVLEESRTKQRTRIGRCGGCHACSIRAALAARATPMRKPKDIIIDCSNEPHSDGGQSPVIKLTPPGGISYPVDGLFSPPSDASSDNVIDDVLKHLSTISETRQATVETDGHDSGTQVSGRTPATPPGSTPPGSPGRSQLSAESPSPGSPAEAPPPGSPAALSATCQILLNEKEPCSGALHRHEEEALQRHEEGFDVAVHTQNEGSTAADIGALRRHEDEHDTAVLARKEVSTLTETSAWIGLNEDALQKEAPSNGFKNEAVSRPLVTFAADTYDGECFESGLWTFAMANDEFDAADPTPSVDVHNSHQANVLPRMGSKETKGEEYDDNFECSLSSGPKEEKPSSSDRTEQRPALEAHVARNVNVPSGEDERRRACHEGTERDGFGHDEQGIALLGNAQGTASDSPPYDVQNTHQEIVLPRVDSKETQGKDYDDNFESSSSSGPKEDKSSSSGRTEQRPAAEAHVARNVNVPSGEDERRQARHEDTEKAGFGHDEQGIALLENAQGTASDSPPYDVQNTQTANVLPRMDSKETQGKDYDDDFESSSSSGPKEETSAPPGPTEQRPVAEAHAARNVNVPLVKDERRQASHEDSESDTSRSVSGHDGQAALSGNAHLKLTEIPPVVVQDTHQSNVLSRQDSKETQGDEYDDNFESSSSSSPKEDKSSSSGRTEQRPATEAHIARNVNVPSGEDERRQARHEDTGQDATFIAEDGHSDVEIAESYGTDPFDESYTEQDAESKGMDSKEDSYDMDDYEDP